MGDIRNISRIHTWLKWIAISCVILSGVIKIVFLWIPQKYWRLTNVSQYNPLLAFLQGYFPIILLSIVALTIILRILLNACKEIIGDVKMIILAFSLFILGVLIISFFCAIFAPAVLLSNKRSLGMFTSVSGIVLGVALTTPYCLPYSFGELVPLDWNYKPFLFIPILTYSDTRACYVKTKKFKEKNGNMPSSILT